MNKSRRNALTKWIKKMEEWGDKGEELKRELFSILSEEEEAFNNMPENLQGGIRGADSEEAIDLLEEAIDCIDKATDAIYEAIVCVEEI